MVLNVFALLFVLGITFMQSLFGLFSGLLDLFCCIVSVSVAFGFTDVLNATITKDLGLHPSYSLPACFVVLFVVTLVALRFLADNFIRGNVRVPMYVDWIGGAVCGFVNAMLCTGMMLIGFLLLPWGDTVMMHTGIERTDKADNGLVRFQENGIWFSPDRFTVGFARMLSAGSLASDTTLASVYPDYARWVAWTGNTVQQESLTAPIRDQSGDGFRKGMEVETWWEQNAALPAATLRYRPKLPKKEDDKPPYESRDFSAGAGKRLLGVRLVLNRASADRDRDFAEHRFRPTMIRLVGDVRRGGRDEPREYATRVLGGADAQIGDNLRLVDPDNNFVIPEGDAKIDVYFEVDDGFTPRFIEYRRFARAPVTKSELAKAPPTKRLKVAAGPGETKGAEAEGAARFIDAVLSDGTGDRDELPFPLALDKVQSDLDVELATEGNERVFASGRLRGDRARFTSDSATGWVRRLKVPEGKRLFQLKTQPKKAQSLPGSILNFVGGVTNQYFAVDDRGDVHALVGYIAQIKRDGQDYLEMAYLPGDDAAFRGGLDLKEIKTRELERDDSYVTLIFAVPPGRSIRRVQTQNREQGISFEGSGYTVREK